jgi:hypothetical protein
MTTIGFLGAGRVAKGRETRDPPRSTKVRQPMERVSCLGTRDSRTLAPRRGRALLSGVYAPSGVGQGVLALHMWPMNTWARRERQTPHSVALVLALPLSCGR